MKNAEELAQAVLPKAFMGYSGVEGFMCQMHFPEFKKALSDHDNELISEIEKKVEENQKKADTAISGNAIFFYDTKVIALTEIINLIKEK